MTILNIANLSVWSSCCRFNRCAVTAALALLLTTTLAFASPVTNQQKNLVSALYSYDSILAFTGLNFGIDPTSPEFRMTGTISDGNFSWSVSNSYLGRPFAFSASGIFNPLTGSTDWSGMGTYGTNSLASSGSTGWTSDQDFAIQDSIALNGSPAFWSVDALGLPGTNVGTMVITGESVPLGDLHVRDDYILIRELNTRHFWSFFVGPVTDGWVVTVSNDGKITSNVYSLNKEGSSVGVVLSPTGPGGTVNFGGQTISKAGLIQSIPEPSNLVLTFSGLCLLVAMRWWSRVSVNLTCDIGR